MPPPPPRRPWGGFAIAGLVGLITGVLVAVVAVALLAETTSPVVAAYGPGEAIGEAAFAQGECALGEPDSVTTYGVASIVPCQEPHDVEVYASVDVPIPEGGTRPSDEDLSLLGDDLCWAAFEPHTGVAWEETSLDYMPLVPGERAWAAGDRTVHCLLTGLEDDGGRRDA